jgi:hypothetical protein
MVDAVSASQHAAVVTLSAPRTASVSAVALCLLFVLLGLVFIPYVGLQDDELLFAAAIYPPLFLRYSLPVFGHPVPAMIMSYVGTLKAAIYAPIFALWPPSPWSVRVPALLLGAAAIWLCFALGRNVMGARAALAAAALLATDVTFLLTTCFDWGPVALQHFLLLAALLLLLRFSRTASLACLAGGFFLLGLALWDKALFVWSLVGLAAAALAAFPRELTARLTPRNVAVAVFAFGLGAMPLISYNRVTHFETFRENAKAPSISVAQKSSALLEAAEGTALLGYMIRSCPAAPWRAAGLLPAACALALLLLPWLWRTPARKVMLFALVFTAVTWGQMLLTGTGGAGPHHTVLLWPFPHLFVAAAFAQASLALPRRGSLALGAAIGVVCGSNLLALGRNFTQLRACGATTIWTGAIAPLADFVSHTPAKRIYVLDWGMMNVLRALGRGSLPLDFARDRLAEPLDGARRAAVLHMAGVEGAVFIDHTPGNAILPPVGGRLVAIAQAAGYRKQSLRVIDDRYGRPIFDVFRFLPPG